MAKIFKKIENFEDLKAQYKALLKIHHPDNGGDVAKMQEINAEYDALFSIWKDIHEASTGEKVTETADSTRSQFYTEFGWEGKNHDWNRSLKEVAQIVRSYVKEKYPTYKFSVRTSYASMCQELHVDLKESPIEIYKSFEDLTYDDKHKLISRMEFNDLFSLTSWSDKELKTEFERIWNENGNFYKCLNDVTQTIIKDVDDFVNSYNYHDCDGMIDYFHVDFYYFGCVQNNGMHIKVVPKVSKEDKKQLEQAAKEKSDQKITGEEKNIEAKVAPDELAIKFSDFITKYDLPFKDVGVHDDYKGNDFVVDRLLEGQVDGYILTLREISDRIPEAREEADEIAIEFMKYLTVEDKKMYEVKVSKLENDSRTIGMASLVINGNMKFNGIRLIKNDSDRGFFVTMPSYKTKDGEYKSIFNPISPEMAASLADATSESLQTGKAVSFETGSEKAETVFVTKSIVGSQKANVRVVFNKDFVCDSIAVRENKDGNLFVAMPSYKGKDGTYKEFCHPITADFRKQINDEIFLKFDYAMGMKDMQKDQNNKDKTSPSSSGRSGR